jgi:hypothetical protein
MPQMTMKIKSYTEFQAPLLHNILKVKSSKTRQVKTPRLMSLTDVLNLLHPFGVFCRSVIFTSGKGDFS